jgi:hypothetical protein
MIKISGSTNQIDMNGASLVDASSVESLSVLENGVSVANETQLGLKANTADVGVANSSLVKTALNASGTAPIYACRAWVNFNGTGTVAIRVSGNVSSITDNGVGNYRGNFINNMSDANYVTLVSFNSGDGNAFFASAGRLSNIQTLSSFAVESLTTGGNIDCPNCYVSIFR